MGDLEHRDWHGLRILCGYDRVCDGSGSNRILQCDRARLSRWNIELLLGREHLGCSHLFTLQSEGRPE